MKKIALITGITGQDGSYLAELLLKKNYQVHGLVRSDTVPQAEDSSSLIQGILEKLEIHKSNILDHQQLSRTLDKIRPDELYHLAAESHVGNSYNNGLATLRLNVEGTYQLLTSLQEINPKCRFYFAASSEMFGLTQTPSQNEDTPFNPVSPYAISKLTGFYLVKMFREAYQLYACSGILFNHESPRRGREYVTRKISQAVARIKFGEQKELRLGNLEVRRDWGFAGDYVQAMWQMLQQPHPEDFVIGTGETHNLRDLLETAFGHAGLDWRKYVIIDQQLFRPVEIRELRADFTKAREKLGWRSEVSFEALIKMMVDAELANFAK